MLIMRKVMSVCLLMAMLCGSALASPRLDDWHRDAWTGKDGAPVDITSITQTTDGWLWLSTPNGLYRFDGVRFDRFQPRAGEALLNTRLTNLYAAPDGALWFGYNGGAGVSMLLHGHMVSHSIPSPGIGAMYEASQDHDGSMWVATDIGLWHQTGGTWRKIDAKQGLRGGVTSSVQVDPYGGVWVTSGGRLFVRRHAGEQFAPVGPDQDSSIIRPSPDGRMWIDAGNQITLVDARPAGSAKPIGPVHGPAASDEWLFDRAGNFWTTKCDYGPCLIHADALAGKSTFQIAAMAQDTLADRRHKPVRSSSLFEDREGNIWVATVDGLERYRPQRIELLPLEKKAGGYTLATDGPNSFWVIPKGIRELWRVTDAAVTRIDGTFDYKTAHNTYDRRVLFSGKNAVEQRAEGQQEATIVRDGHGQPLPPVSGGGIVTFDGTDYWARTDDVVVAKLVQGRWRPIAELGFPPGARSIGLDSQGHIWIWYNDKIVDARSAPGKAYGKAEGIDIDHMRRLSLSDRIMVLGTAGVAVKIGARFYPLRIDRQEMLFSALATIQSANGDLWINAYDGLLRVPAPAWKAWLAQPGGIITTELFDSADGYSGGQGVSPARMVTTDNGKRVWFVGKAGLASIDSTTIVRNAVAPRAEVVRLHAGSLAYVGADRPRLAAGTRSISFDYTALTFIMPERIRFKYRLDGVDEQWQDGASRRTVDYTNLGPGSYRFQVIAANEDGVWGAVPAVMHFSIAPLFTQTWWFFTLCGLVVLGALSLLYRARVRSVRKHAAARTHERLFERERIARTLHDTYLQSVQGLIYVLQSEAHRQPAPDGTPHPLGRALALADDVLIQGREQVMGLRMSAQGAATLAESLAEVGLGLAESTPMDCSVTTSGQVRDLRGHVMEELFSIGREALINAFRHSRGRRVDVVLHYATKKFTMTIQDDGIGLPATMLEHGNRSGHWGLPGMRERADAVNGTLTTANLPGGGTCVVLTVPARTAYVSQGTAWPALARWSNIVRWR